MIFFDMVLDELPYFIDRQRKNMRIVFVLPSEDIEYGIYGYSFSDGGMFVKMLKEDYSGFLKQFIEELHEFVEYYY